MEFLSSLKNRGAAGFFSRNFRRRSIWTRLGGVCTVIVTLAHCTRDQRSSVTGLNAPVSSEGVQTSGKELIQDVWGISMTQWDGLVKDLGRRKLEERPSDPLDQTVCFVSGDFDDQGLPVSVGGSRCSSDLSSRSKEYGSASPVRQEDDSPKKKASKALTTNADYWKEIGFDPYRITVKQWNEAQTLFLPDTQLKQTFSLVEPAKSIREKAHVCVKLVRLFDQFKKAHDEPDCNERFRAMAQLALEPETYKTLIEGSEIIHVAAQATERFFPDKQFTRMIRQVNGLNQCVVMPAYRLKKRVEDIKWTLGNGEITWSP